MCSKPWWLASYRKRNSKLVDEPSDNSYVFADEDHVRREKAKVKDAKKSRWWQQKTSAGLCHYCSRKFAFKQLTLDHVVPLARGGTTSPGNVVPACRACNKAKGADTPVDLLFGEGKENSNGEGT